MLSPTGMFVGNSDDPIAQMGAGVVQSGGTDTQFTIVYDDVSGGPAVDRKFVFEGYGFTFATIAGVLQPTGGVITAIHEFTNEAIPTPLVNFGGVGVAAAAWYAAVVEAALNGPNGPSPPA